MWKDIAFVALGGSMGAVSRYLVSGWGNRLAPDSIPYGTMMVNVLGCFLLGLLMGGTLFDSWLLRHHKLALGAGFLGSFTTFSTFGVETIRLAQNDQLALAGFYVGIKIVLGLAAAGLGVYIGQTFLSAR